MEDVFLLCLDFTRTEEGGYTCDPHDSGNWSSGLIGRGRLVGSNMGVSAPTLISWLGRDDAATVTAGVMRTLAESTYQAIAKARYWRSMSCDNLTGPVAMMVFDFGWNVGVATSARLLQSTIGLQGELVDGDLGPRTIAAANALRWPAIIPKLDDTSVKVLQRMCHVPVDGIAGAATIDALTVQPALMPIGLALALGCVQTEFYRKLPNFGTYGKGWLARTERRVDAATKLSATSPDSGCWVSGKLAHTAMC